jgi:putative DNA primase/helicase
MNAGVTLETLAAAPLWVAWQTEDRPVGKPTKVPYAPTGQKARANGPTTWGTREQAETRAALLPKLYGVGGVGLELSEIGREGLSIGGIDLDSCREPDAPMSPWAAEVVHRFDSYTETSPSGTGDKIFFLYTTADLTQLREEGLIEAGDGAKRLPGYGRQFKRGGGDHPPAIELHLGNRYFAVTDQRLPDAPAELRLVTLDTLRWLLSEAGPAFAGTQHKPGASAAGASAARASGSGTDKSRSAIAFRKAGQAHRDGKSFDEMVALLTLDPETSDWVREKGTAKGQRELHRIWEKIRSALPDDGLITEGNVARAFAVAHRNRLRYCHTTGAWFEWTGTHWKQETTKLAYRWAHEKAKALANDTADVRAILAAGKAAFAAGVERIAQSDRSFAVTSESWDADRWLLGTPSGTVDLRTGVLREPLRNNFITKITGCSPARTADCPLWQQFLKQATNDDIKLIRFMQQWAGYSLTGDTTEDALVFVHGPGGNGKGVFLNAHTAILGDYCQIAAMDTFTASQTDRHPTDLAMLKGARMVCVSETEEGRAWAESRIKALTGRDKISARFMRQNFFTYRPEFKLTIIGNHKPILKNVDDAAKRRFNMVPFLHKPENPDRQLDAKLAKEYPAILRWMIDGCLDWQKNGLVRPSVVLEATADYFIDQDTLRQWTDDCCDEGKGLADTNGSLFASWHNYAKSRGEDPRSQRWFKPALERLGYVAIKDAHGIRGRGFSGLKVHVNEPVYQEDR